MTQLLRLPSSIRQIAENVAREHGVTLIMLIGLAKKEGQPLRDRRMKTPELVKARRALIREIYRRAARLPDMPEDTARQ
jgi:hypothetical protein